MKCRSVGLLAGKRSYFLLKLNPYQIQCMNNQYETFIQSLKIQKAKHPNTYNSGSQGERDLNAFLKFSTNRVNQKLHFWHSWYETVLYYVILTVLFYKFKCPYFFHHDKKSLLFRTKLCAGFYLDWLPFVFVFRGLCKFLKSRTIRQKFKRKLTFYIEVLTRKIFDIVNLS